MKRVTYTFDQLVIFRHIVRWTMLCVPVAALAGSLVALFLWLLDLATQIRFANNWLLYLLPLAGVAIYFLYRNFGKNTEAGNNLIIDEIHEPGGGIPARMAPLVLITTVVTHLFGGSAGREGTAVQMGGSIAYFLAKKFRLDKADVRILLMTGVAAGFGAVFGTPVTGAIFALEVLAIGRLRYDALLPCFIASVVGHLVCIAWGIQHTVYSISYIADTTSVLIPGIDLLLFAKVAFAGVLFGLVSFAFAELTHLIRETAIWLSPKRWLVPAGGGLVIIGLTLVVGTTDYLGLGVVSETANGVSIVNAFHEGGATLWSWLWKLVFTVVTIGTGFKGGEVTPLFFIGATLGNAIGVLMDAPISLFAALGFIAVFAGATNTPLACTIMGVELFGSPFVIYYAIACFIAYYFSGHSGIYQSQLISVYKSEKQIEEHTLKRYKQKKREEKP